MPPAVCSEPSVKTVTSVGSNAAYHFLKAAAAVFLSILSVGSVSQLGEKCRELSIGLGISGRSAPRRCTFVLGRCRVPVPLFLAIIGRVIQCTSEYPLSIVLRYIAKRSFASSRAAIADGSPASR